eukprot:gene10247-11342_t
MANLLFSLDQRLLQLSLSSFLDWEDLSALDVACLGESRSRWLEVARGLISSAPPLHSIPAVREFWQWIGHRGIFLERIQLHINDLDLLLSNLDSQGYSIIREMKIFDDEGMGGAIDKNKLLDLMGRCTNLRALALDHLYINEVLLRKLGQAVPPLESIDLSNLILRKWDVSAFLGRHVPVLKELKLWECQIDGNKVINYLHKNNLSLEVLQLGAGHKMALAHKMVLDYLTAHGESLRSLHLEGAEHTFPITKDLLTSILGLCPRLEFLALSSAQSSVGTLSLSPIFQAHPHLKAISLNDLSIEFDEEDRTVELKSKMLEMHTNWEDWIACLLTILKDGYRLGITHGHGNRFRAHANEFKLVIDQLHPYLSALTVDVHDLSDELFVDLIARCPLLTWLDIRGWSGVLSDASLRAIILHQPPLRCLDIMLFGMSEQNPLSDEVIAEVIEACDSLDNLRIPSAGCQAIKAVSKHPTLTNFSLTIDGINDDILSLLLDDEVKWPDGLKRGLFRLPGQIFITLADEVSTFKSAGFSPGTRFFVRQRHDGNVIYMSLPSRMPIQREILAEEVKIVGEDFVPIAK